MPPITFAAGETVKTLALPLFEDVAIEFDEWFRPTLTLPDESPLTLPDESPLTLPDESLLTLDRARVLVDLLDNDGSRRTLRYRSATRSSTNSQGKRPSGSGSIASRIPR